MVVFKVEAAPEPEQPEAGPEPEQICRPLDSTCDDPAFENPTKCCDELTCLKFADGFKCKEGACEKEFERECHPDTYPCCSDQDDDKSDFGRSECSPTNDENTPFICTNGN